MSPFHFGVAEIATPNFLTLLYTGRSLALFTTGAKFDQVKPKAYSPRNITLKQLSFSPSTITHVGEFSGVSDVFDGLGVGKIFFASNKTTGSVYSCFSGDVTVYANLVIRHVGVPRSVLSHVNKREI